MAAVADYPLTTPPMGNGNTALIPASEAFFCTGLRKITPGALCLGHSRRVRPDRPFPSIFAQGIDITSAHSLPLPLDRGDLTRYAFTLSPLISAAIAHQYHTYVIFFQVQRNRPERRRSNLHQSLDRIFIYRMPRGDTTVPTRKTVPYLQVGPRIEIAELLAAIVVKSHPMPTLPELKAF